jgi:hypothetical protein
MAWLGSAVGLLSYRGRSRAPVVVQEVHTLTNPMPRRAQDAALRALCGVLNRQHPDMEFLPLEASDGAIVMPTPGKILRPFAGPQDTDALI